MEPSKSESRGRVGRTPPMPPLPEQESVPVTPAESVIAVEGLELEQQSRLELPPEDTFQGLPGAFQATEDSNAARVAATEELVAKFHADVFRYSYWLSGCSNAAEDITQETFLQAYRALHALRDPAAAKGWLMTIARREFSRWCKKSPNLADIDECQEIAAPKASSHVDGIADGEWLETAIGQLPAEFRLVVLMYYFEQLSYAEISEQLEIPLGTVMSRLSRGRQHLRDAWNSLEQPETDGGE